MTFLRSWAALMLFCLLRWLCQMLQYVYHSLNGVHSKRAGMSRSSQVEVFKVIARSPSAAVGLQDESHFILWHRQFHELEYILEPRVTLYMIDGDLAYFVKTPKNIELYDTQEYPFFYMAQQQMCSHVITMPLDNFLHLSSTLTMPQCQWATLLHVARCGSTAVTQRINKLPDWTVVAESCFIQKHFYDQECKNSMDLNNYIQTEKCFDVVEGCIKFMLKDFSSESKVLIKQFGIGDATLIPALTSRFPDQKIIWMQRDGINTAISHFRALYSLSYDLTSVFFLYPLSSYFLQKTASRIIFAITNGMMSEFAELISPTVTSCDTLVLHYWRWITNSVQYKRYHRLTSNICVYHFEDFIADQAFVLTQIFNFLKIDPSMVNLALTALERDSQMGSVLSKSAVEKNRSWEKNEHSIAQCNKIKEMFRRHLSTKRHSRTESSCSG